MLDQPGPKVTLSDLSRDFSMHAENDVVITTYKFAGYGVLVTVELEDSLHNPPLVVRNNLA